MPESPTWTGTGYLYGEYGRNVLVSPLVFQSLRWSTLNESVRDRVAIVHRQRAQVDDPMRKERWE